MTKYCPVDRTKLFAAIPFLLLSAITMMMLSGCSDSRTYSVSGKITSGGAPLSGIVVTFADEHLNTITTTTTDVNGNYSFTDISGGIYTVTPSRTSFGIFTPPFRKAYLDGLSAVGFDFSVTNAGRLGGTNHTVFLKTDGTVWAWGNNSNGQLGNGTTDQSDVPVQVGGISGVTAVAAGYQYTAALKVDNTVWTWGNNNYGQLGNGATTGSLTPVQAQLP